MDALRLVLDTTVPLASTLGGWMLALMRLRARMRSLERAVRQLEKSEAERLETLRGGLRLEFEHHSELLEERIGQLKEELSRGTSQLEKLRESSHDFAKDAKLGQYILEQSERWERMERAIGMLTGWIKARWPESPSVPPPHLPRRW